MLIIERCKDESIVIDGDIEIMIAQVRGQKGNEKVRLAITAPRKISVHRKEVQDAINREKEVSQALTA